MRRDRRRELADAAVIAWDRYASAVRRGAAYEERQFTADAAFDADEKLAAFDWQRRSKENREMAARALSGA